MNTFELLRRISRDEKGATSVEYALIMGLVFLSLIGAVIALGDEDSSLFNRVSSTSVTAMSGAV